MPRITKNYISEADQKLAEYNSAHQKTPSQQEEIDKYSRIHALVKNPHFEEPDAEGEDLWDF